MSRRARRRRSLCCGLALALLGAGAGRAAEEGAPSAFSGSAAALGVGHLSDDNQRFGRYTGLRREGAYGLLEFDLERRDPATAAWFSITGRDLGLESRELRLEAAHQGGLSYYAEFGRTPSYLPHTVRTNLQGVGTSSLLVGGPGAARDFDDLKTRRDNLSLGVDQQFAGGVDLRVRFRSEDKQGVRPFGQGESPFGSLTFFLTEPIDYTTRELEASFAYAGERSQVNGGYYGTAFENRHPALQVAGTVFSPVALPPGNLSHQLYLAGGHDFTEATRGTFKLAYARQTQEEGFVVPAANGRADLGGRVDTSQMQLGLTARPLPKLSLVGDLRYNDRRDETPVVQYGPSLAGGTTDGTNEPRSIESTSAKLEAGYQLPGRFRLSGGAYYERKDRSLYPIRLVSQRARTEETSHRVELRRSMSETIGGAVSYVRSEREGSPFPLNVLNGSLTPGSNLVAPLHHSDRERDKLRLSLNWSPLPALSVQFHADEARDRYASRTAAMLGPQTGEARNYSIDAGYELSSSWQANAWLSRNTTRARQTTLSDPDLWRADLRSTGDSFGLGLKGQPTGRLALGADLQHFDMTDESRLQAVTGAPLASLPDISTRSTTLKLWGRYDLSKSAGLRLDYLRDVWRSDDWTWTSWVYTDGTRFIQAPVQKVEFIGLSGYFRWL